MLKIVDQVVRECLAVIPYTSLSGHRVARELADIIAWCGKPMQNGDVESFNDLMRDELLNERSFYGFEHARAVIREWAEDLTNCRPPASIGYSTPSSYAEMILPMGSGMPEAFANMALKGITTTAATLVRVG